MKAIFDARQLRHNPERYFRHGAYITHPEQAERAILIRDELVARDFAIETPRDFGEAPIKAVHDGAYVDFWKDAHKRWTESVGDAEGIPTCHPGRRVGRPSSTIQGQLGFYATDTSVPLGAHMWTSLYWSAQTAVEAAERVCDGERLVYGLCRPPGHHAMRDCANGFCVFNNSAIAAHHLTRHFDRIALLDIDTHTGNGSLDIFYARDDVFFCSLHADPEAFPTYYLGHADETGEGAGAGCSLNLPLELGVGDAVVLERFEEGLAAIRDFGATALVVSLGFDMAGDDPLSEIDLSSNGFAAMARGIVGLGLPTALIQEGGYLGPSLARNAGIFLATARDSAAANGHAVNTGSAS